MDVTASMEAAQAQTGFDDYGPEADAMVEALTVLVRSANDEADLSEQGETVFGGMVVSLLTRRLEIEHWYAEHPEIDDQEIASVLFGVGLPRTGSTALSYLLAQDRRLVSMTLPNSPWGEAMDWLKGAPPTWYVLADPGHAWKYGVSVRLAAEKDTLVEAGKDTALAMYDRRIALAVADRLSALRDFDRLDDAELRALGERYGVDVAIVDASRHLSLPELHRNSQFVIYRLR